MALGGDTSRPAASSSTARAEVDATCAAAWMSGSPVASTYKARRTVVRNVGGRPIRGVALMGGRYLS
jgi:hypothetical protein